MRITAQGLELDRLSVVPRADFDQEHLSRTRAEQALHLLKVLTEITSDLGGASAEADVLDIVRRRLTSKLEAPTAALWAFIDGQLQQLTSTSPRTRGGDHTTAAPSELVVEVFETGEPRVLDDGAAAQIVSDLPAAGRVALLPLALAERRVGVLEVAWDRPPEGLGNAEHRELLEAVASQVAQALERSWLYEAERAARQEAESKTKQLRLQQDLALCLANTRGVLHLAGTVVEFAVTSLRSGGAGLLQIDDQRDAMRLLAVRSVPTLDAESGVLPLSSDGACARAARLREVVISDLPLTETEEPSQLICLPLMLERRVVGVLALVRPVVDEWEATFLDGLSLQCAMALERARLHDASQRKSRVLQRDLLPIGVPAIPDTDLALRYRPVSRQREVGGDFYDIFQVADGTWGLLIGDVSGRGPAAASLTAMVRYTVRTAARREGNLTRMLGLLNEAVLDATAGDDRFCTVAYVEVTPGPPVRLRMISGGHPLPVLLDGDGRVRTVGTPGLAIGLLPGLHWSDERLVLQPGEALTLYTDGVGMARAADGAFAEDLVGSVLRDADGADAEELVDRIERLTLDFSQGSPRDDLAVVVLRTPTADERNRTNDSSYVTLERDPASVPAARRAVRTFLRAHGCKLSAEDQALTLIGEVVHNALTHAQTAVGLRMRVRDSVLRVEVSDGSPAVPAFVAHESGDARPGKGVRLLDELTDAWDVRRHPNRKTVWFDLNLADRPDTPHAQDRRR